MVWVSDGQDFNDGRIFLYRETEDSLDCLPIERQGKGLVQIETTTPMNRGGIQSRHLENACERSQALSHGPLSTSHRYEENPNAQIQ